MNTRTPVLRRGIGSVVVLVGAMLVAGCSQGGNGGLGADSPKGAAPTDSTEGGKWPAAQAQSGLAKGLSLPLQPYLVSYSQKVTVQRAQLAVQRSCMKRLGFSYNPPEPGHFPPPSADDANMPRRYGLSDLDEARERAYRLPETGEPPADEVVSEAANAALMGRSSSGGQSASGGVPAGGCVGESERRIGALDGSLAGRLNNESFEASKADPKVRAAVQSWSTCMRGKGYTVSTPLDAAKLVRVKGEPPLNPSKREINVATADVECKKSTNLVDSWFKAESAIQEELIEKNQLALQEDKGATEAAVKKAATSSS
ncbi:hypothetical protein ACIO3O_42000 [Streptomyces sp. NPDC087440]|uniref:hypothetical protein n=1 Tax=Streptomyces sp. NPDC087440 TaxID=3365790 RepID=UPI00381CFADB